MCVVPISVSLTVDPIRAAALLRLRASGEEDLQWDGWLAGWTYNLTMVEVQCEVERYCQSRTSSDNQLGMHVVGQSGDLVEVYLFCVQLLQGQTEQLNQEYRLKDIKICVNSIATSFSVRRESGVVVKPGDLSPFE